MQQLIKCPNCGTILIAEIKHDCLGYYIDCPACEQSVDITEKAIKAKRRAREMAAAAIIV